MSEAKHDAEPRAQRIERPTADDGMAATLGVIVTEAGIKFPGYLSISQDLTFGDVPGSLDGAYFGVPLAGWAQIVCLIAILDNSLFAQDPNEAPGDVAAGIPWVRYSDPSVRCPGRTSVSLCCSRWPNTCSRLCHPHHKQVKEWKLNAERNNGRAAMMGIIGMIIHEALTGNPVWPIPVPPQPVLELAVDDVEKGPARVGSFVLASLGMAFLGAASAVPEFNKQK